MTGPPRGKSDTPMPLGRSTAARRPASVVSWPASWLWRRRPEQSTLHLLFYRLQVLLRLLQFQLSRIFQFGTDLSRHLHEHPPPQRYAHFLKLRLLLRIEQWLDLLVNGDADAPQLLELLRTTELGVALECLQFLDLVI